MSEATATPAPEAAPVTDNAATEANPVSTETAKPAEAKAEAKETPKEPKAAVNPDEKAYRLKELIEITEKNPNKVLSAEDQAIYDEHVLDGLKPKDRPAAKEEKPVEKAEKPVEKAEKAEVPEHIAAAMKEVGAKTPEELTAKVKELRQVVSGKETEAVQRAKQEGEAKLRSAATAEAALWRDFVDGKPEALAYVAKAYGIQPKAQVQQPQESDISPDALAEADALTGGITSKVIAQNRALQDRLDRFEQQFTGHQKTIQEQGIRQTVSAQVVDEMVATAGEIPELAAIPGLRNVIIDRVVHGKQDPRLDTFNELFQIAQEAGTDLRNALLIKRGRESALLIEKAREEGRKQAYEHKPNRSLSSIQTEDAEPQSITDAQLALMEKDPRAIPDNWLDKNGNLDKARIPKKAWPAFGLE